VPVFFLTIQDASGMKIFSLIIIFLSFSLIMSMMLLSNKTHNIDIADDLSRHERNRTVSGEFERKATPVEEGKQPISNSTNETDLSASKSYRPTIPTKNSVPILQSTQSEASSAMPPNRSAIAGSPFNGSKNLPVEDVIVSDAASNGALEIWIPAQASVPAVLASGAVTLPSISPQANAGAATQSPTAAKPARAVESIEKISENFFSDVTQRPGEAPVSLQEWEDASMEADERFRSLRGHDAYLRYKLEAAKESLSSLKNPQ